MKINSKVSCCIMILIGLIPMQAEVLIWKASKGQQYETRKTITESVITLDSVTQKPVLIVQDAILQETAAKKKSTISHIEGIPSFPQSSIEPGVSWQETAKITYNLQNYGSSDPLVLVVPVNYSCGDFVQLDNRSYYNITASWYTFHITDIKEAKETGISRIVGKSIMTILWDEKSGSPKKIVLNEAVQYRFTDDTSFLYKKEINDDFRTVTDIVRERIINQLQQQIISQKVENVEVKQTDDGIVLSIENIQFEPDSAKLVETEKKKISSIGNLLSTLKDRKLNIVGHAANMEGSDEEELLTLSTDRAQTVAQFLIDSGFRTANSVIFTGMGGSVPLASNDTTEGRSKNRRVEIIIMDQEDSE